MSAVTLELDDIQGLFARGYGDLPRGLVPAARGSTDAAAAAALARRTGADGHDGREQRPDGSRAQPRAHEPGLRGAGPARPSVAGDVLRTSSSTGMATAAPQPRCSATSARTRPADWEWGGPGRDPVARCCCSLYARDADAPGALVARADRRDSARAAWSAAAPARARPTSTTSSRSASATGSRSRSSRALRRPGRAERRSSAPASSCSATPTSTASTPTGRCSPPRADPQRVLPPTRTGSGRADLGRNGSYLVLRQLRAGRRRLLALRRRGDPRRRRAAPTRRRRAGWPRRWSAAGRAARRSCSRPTPTTRARRRERLRLPPRRPARAALPGRRAHPPREPARLARAPARAATQSLAINRRHRLLRRGRSYGLDATASERGLHFICLNANIARQFEFVQHTWLNNPKFDGLRRRAATRWSARVGDGGTAFTEPAVPVRRRRYPGCPGSCTSAAAATSSCPGSARCATWPRRAIIPSVKVTSDMARDKSVPAQEAPAPTTTPPWRLCPGLAAEKLDRARGLGQAAAAARPRRADRRARRCCGSRTCSTRRTGVPTRQPATAPAGTPEHLVTARASTAPTTTSTTRRWAWPARGSAATSRSDAVLPVTRDELLRAEPARGQPARC